MCIKIDVFCHNWTVWNLSSKIDTPAENLLHCGVYL